MTRTAMAKEKIIPSKIEVQKVIRKLVKNSAKSSHA
jgi:hypothetical protein